MDPPPSYKPPSPRHEVPPSDEPHAPYEAAPRKSIYAIPSHAAPAYKPQYDPLPYEASQYEQPPSPAYEEEEHHTRKDVAAMGAIFGLLMQVGLKKTRKDLT